MKTSRKKSCVVHAGRWISYAVAGAATAVAASNDAEASILFSGILNTPMPHSGGGTFLKMKTLLANSDAGVKTFARFTHNSGSTPGGPLGGGGRHTYSLRLRGLNINPYKVHGAVLGTKHGTAWYASRLASGVPISAGHFNTTNKFNGMAYWGGPSGQSTHVGNRKWSAAGTAFVGFEFNAGSGEQYGWAKVSDPGPKQYYMTLIDYAYGTVGQAIATGQTTVPEPASLGLLALGAAGLLATRVGRRREAPQPII